MTYRHVDPPRHTQSRPGCGQSDFVIGICIQFFDQVRRDRPWCLGLQGFDCRACNWIRAVVNLSEDVAAREATFDKAFGCSVRKTGLLFVALDV